MRGTGYAIDTDERSLETRVPVNSKILILTDMNGKIQNANGPYGNLFTKVVWEGRELFLHSSDLSYHKKIRVIATMGVQISEKPELNSKILGTLNYNTSVKIVSETDPDRKPNSFVKVTDDQISGWALGKNFTNEDYDVEFYKKAMSDIMSKFYFSVQDEMNEIDIGWNGTDFGSVECSLKGNLCFIYMYFGKEKYGDLQEVLHFEIKKEQHPGAPDYTCELRKIELVRSFESANGKRKSPAISCEGHNFMEDEKSKN